MMTDPKPIQAEIHRPFVLIVCHSLTGHLSPLIRIAAALHALGWETFFLGPTAHRRGIEAAGAVFLPLRADADLDDKAYYESPPFPKYAALHWADRVLVDLRNQCLDPLPTQWSCFVDALRALRTRDPERKIILLAEAFFYGILPLFYGASLPHDLRLEEILLGSLCVSVTIPAIRSVDLPPVGYPFPFDSSPDGRVRNANLWERSWERKASYLTALLSTKMRETGASHTVREMFLSGANYLCHNTILQLGVPGFEYPRSDWPPTFKFAGLVQGPPPSSKFGAQPSSPTPARNSKIPNFPWWSELASNTSLSTLLPSDPGHTAKKKIIVVAQGTVEINPYDLIVPTLHAFANRSDVLVIAILGWKDANLSSYGVDIEIPPNVRIADYISYDAVLAHADVWVHNGGFGAVNHGIANGVPMVVAGEGMDKTENSRRVAWSGIGVDLGCAKPSVEQVRGAVERVLEDERFTKRVRELQKQSQEIDCFGIVHSELVRIMKTRPGIKQQSLES
ncbi:glycosyltransferase family 1 protein [Daldinia decipiens]|uniref:glycosyltransferase family 1 protein n=1 Tax=Daldinia decipiens TaxID=326647 RepID=UPI0020C249EA|nr:glycosyltransferase family 1 protein [Daldinia decipiens]KAI1654014.1 glycosyltransferase family 1 protein [Daldinia decipiens]